MHKTNLNKLDRNIAAKLKGKRGFLPDMPGIGAIVAPRKNPGKTAFRAQKRRYKTFTYPIDNT